MTPSKKTETTPSVTTQASYIPSEDFTLPDSNNPNGKKITFDLGDGRTYVTTTNKNDLVSVPTTSPTRQFATFKGWYVDDKEFNFNQIVTTETTIVAKWDYDYPGLVNYIYLNTIKACVKVTNKSIKKEFMSKSYTTSIGSGIIFDEDSSNYYILTNNHVVYFNGMYTEYNAKDTVYDYAEYYITDCYGTEHTAKLIGNKPEYDLALLSIEKKSSELEVIKLANNSYVSENYVFSLGNPKSLSNSISFGTIIGRQVFTPKAETTIKSNVTFEVINHDSEINNGSSGGALLNYNLELVGINFASTVSSVSDEFIRGYAIPIEKVKEFINIYVRN